jgi:elongation factor G
VSESNLQNRHILSVVITAKNDHDQESLQRALTHLAQQDSSLRIKTGPLDGQTTIGGMGELHLEVICERIMREYKVEICVDEPKVIYLETIRKPSEAEGKYIRAVSRHQQYGHVKLRIEPRDAGSGYQFVDVTSEGTIPREFVEPINSGIQAAMQGGILAGHEIVDVRAVLCGGGSHAGESNEMAYKIAGSMAFKEAARKASPVILEPYMTVEVATPEEFAGVIIGNLSLRRGRIEGMRIVADSLLIQVVAPLSAMLGYATYLGPATQARASYSMHLAGYEAVSGYGEGGADTIGVTANKPKRPKAGSGFAAADLDSDL